MENRKITVTASSPDEVQRKVGKLLCFGAHDIVVSRSGDEWRVTAMWRSERNDSAKTGEWRVR